LGRIFLKIIGGETNFFFVAFVRLLIVLSWIWTTVVTGNYHSSGERERKKEREREGDRNIWHLEY
jgi:hypothetical protein